MIENMCKKKVNWQRFERARFAKNRLMFCKNEIEKTAKNKAQQTN